MTTETLFDGVPDVKVDDAKICVKCGAATKGFRRPGPGHPTIPYCKVCFYPKRYAYCSCKRPMSAKSKMCLTCRRVAGMTKRVARLEKLKPTLGRTMELKKLRAALAAFAG